MNKIFKTDVILVTGAGGGLGTAFKEVFRDCGYSNILAPSKQELNLLSKEEVGIYFARHKPVAVFHLASLVYGLLGNLENQFKSVSENTRINSNLMDVICESQVKYIFFAGTVASYPYPYASMPLKESEFFNGLPHSGEFGYAMAKRHAFSYLKILSECKSVDYTYGIYTNLYGENDRFDTHSGHVIPSLVAKGFAAAQGGRTLEIWGDGSAERDFLHFIDAARASLHAMESGLTGLLNISSGTKVKIGDVASSVGKFFSVEVKFITDKPVGIPMRYVDNNRLVKSGFKQRIQIDSGLNELCKWYSENANTVRR